MSWDEARFDVEFVSDGRETRNQRLKSLRMTELQDSDNIKEESSEWDSSVSNSDYESFTPKGSTFINRKAVENSAMILDPFERAYFKAVPKVQYLSFKEFES